MKMKDDTYYMENAEIQEEANLVAVIIAICIVVATGYLIYRAVKSSGPKISESTLASSAMKVSEIATQLHY